MSRMMLARVVLAVIGVIIWGYGTATDDANIRLAGIGCLMVSLVLRFAPKGRPSRPPHQGDSPDTDDRGS